MVFAIKGNARKSRCVPIALPAQTAAEPWTRYVRGVIEGFRTRGIDVKGFDAYVHSDVPIGAGLSSSAALTVAMATVLEQLTGTTLDPTDKAHLCQAAERDFAGTPCGIMDPLVAIRAVNDVVIYEGMTLSPVSFTVFDALVPAVNLTVTATSSDIALLPDSGIEILGIGTNRYLRITPAQPIAVLPSVVTVTVAVNNGIETVYELFDVTIEAVADVEVVRLLPDSYLPNLPVTVVLNVIPGAGVTTYTIVEYLPTGRWSLTIRLFSPWWSGW